MRQHSFASSLSRRPHEGTERPLSSGAACMRVWAPREVVAAAEAFADSFARMAELSNFTLSAATCPHTTGCGDPGCATPPARSPLCWQHVKPQPRMMETEAAERAWGAPAQPCGRQPDGTRGGLCRVGGYLRPASPASSAGGAGTSAGRSPPCADVGSRTRSSSRRRAAACGCGVAFPSSLASASRRLAALPTPRLAPARRARLTVGAVGPSRSAPRSWHPAARPLGPLVPAARAPERAERRASGERAAGPGGSSVRGSRRREDGGQAADPDGQREAQQEHHAARQRGQDLEKCPRREGIGRTLVVGPLHFRCLRLCYFPDYSKYQDGHVK